MASAINPLERLNQAIEIANKEFVAEPYQVRVTPNGYHNAKSPVYLELASSDQVLKIGPIHLVKLEGRDWDAKPYEELARPLEEVALAIKLA